MGIFIMRVIYNKKGMKRYGICIFNELRAVKETVANIYSNLVDVLDADIFICTQKTFEDDAERLKLFDRKVVCKEIYERPDPLLYMPKIREFPYGGNWRYPGGEHFYVNMWKMAQVLKMFSAEYDYFIFMRSDTNVLFPIKKDFWENAIHVQEGSEHGGINMNMLVIPSQIVVEYCLSFSDCVNEPYSFMSAEHDHLGLDKNHLNTERYCRNIFIHKKYETKIYPCNCFLTAGSLDDRTSWSVIQYDNEKGVFYKYKEQLDLAFDNKRKYNDGQLY